MFVQEYINVFLIEKKMHERFRHLQTSNICVLYFYYNNYNKKLNYSTSGRIIS